MKGTSGISTFTADVIQDTKQFIGISSVSSGKVTVPGLTWPGISTSNNLVSSQIQFRDLPVINRVSNVNTSSITSALARTGCLVCVMEIFLQVTLK